ncbi:hypothetical protein [Ewingella americana]|uniref:Uncharacterized protein n=1 Tax=Ewingella americana TaxID=41202 RepID=A0A502GDG4_9GAMM|nr:hypothetical protein [Ewingella americana]TPG59904.1 hypothetical protein EAH77_15165 [Ewingella americana]
MFNKDKLTSVQLSGIQVESPVLYQGKMTKVVSLDAISGKLLLENEISLHRPFIIPSAEIFCVFDEINTVDPLRFIQSSMADDFRQDCEDVESGKTTPFDIIRQYVFEKATTIITSERTGYIFQMADRYFKQWLKAGDVYFTTFGKEGVYPVIVTAPNYPFMDVVFPYADAEDASTFDKYSLGVMSIVNDLIRREDFESQDAFFAQIKKLAAEKGYGGFNDWKVAQQVSVNYQNGFYVTPVEEVKE